MEAREILIANTRTQKKYKLTTAATTLGELKHDMAAAGIDYEGLTVSEGITKTEFLSDEAQLPKTVMHKGQPTSTLIIVLTNSKKNIESGITGTREEAFALIEKEELEDAFCDSYDYDSYTDAETEELWEFLNDYLIGFTTAENEKTANDCIADFVKALHDNGFLDDHDLINIGEQLIEYPDMCEKKNPERLLDTRISSTDGKVTNDDVNEAIKDIASV